MYRDHRIAAVVPAHNETAHIERVITTMPELVDHIVIVDDASADDTADLAEAVGDPRVVVIRLEENLGVGGAILTGHAKALELGAEINVIFAGDGQMDPTHVTRLLDPIVDGPYGFAKANRFYSMQSFAGMPRHRIFGNVVLSFLTKLASGYWNLFDPQNGYTAISREALERLDFDKIANGYEFENDLLINLNILGIHAIDVEIPAVYGEEVSGMRLRRVAPAIASLLFRGYWKRITLKYVIRSFSPIALFLLTGLAMVIWAIGFGIWVIVQTIGPDAATTGTVILSVVPFILGVQFLLAALVLDIIATPD